MEFRLHYRGPLKAAGNPTHKHALRCQFHSQLKELWNQLPLLAVRDRALDPSPPQIPPEDWQTDDFKKAMGMLQFPSLVRSIGAFKFVPLVNESLNLVAELKVTLLRPEAPGAIVTQGGDIDNRLKTLFDALKVPQESALPTNAQPKLGEDPFHCLLEDDNLITSISVTTDRLLEQSTDASEVVLVIHVATKATITTWANISLA